MKEKKLKEERMAYLLFESDESDLDNTGKESDISSKSSVPEAYEKKQRKHRKSKGKKKYETMCCKQEYQTQW